MALLTVGMLALLGIAALAVDMGRLYLIRGELQNAADAAALAGAIELAGNGARRDLYDSAKLAAAHTASLNKVDGGRELNPGDLDIRVGHLDTSTTPPTVNDGYGKDLPKLNGVEVTARQGVGGNGPVLLWFARTLGVYRSELSASATAQAVSEGEGAGQGLKKRPWDLTFVIDVSGSMRAKERVGTRQVKEWGVIGHKRVAYTTTQWVRVLVRPGSPYWRRGMGWGWRWVKQTVTRYRNEPIYGWKTVTKSEYSTRLDLAKEAMNEMSDYFQKSHPEDRIGLGTFNSSGSTQQSLGNWNTEKPAASHADLANRVKGLQANGGTNIGRGLSKAIDNHVREGHSDDPGYRWNPTDPSGNSKQAHHQHIMLMSDGCTCDRNGALAQARRAKALGIRIDTVAFGSGADQRMLKQIADITGGKFYDCSDVTGDKLARVFKHVKEQSDNNGQPAYTEFALVY